MRVCGRCSVADAVMSTAVMRRTMDEVRASVGAVGLGR